MLDAPEEDAVQQTAVDYVDITADLVSAYVSNNSIPTSELSSLLTTVHAALSGLATRGSALAKDAVEKLTPAQIKKSITHDALISFEDGKPYKTLKRHLTIRGLTPHEYRAKYGLPLDYPMTSASYSSQRSELARSLGLGQQRNGKGKAAAPEEAVSEAAAEPKQKKAGRPRKAS